MIKTKSISLLLVITSVLIFSCNRINNSNQEEGTRDSVSSEREVELSEPEIKNLNNFFSSFSEVYIPEFRKGSIPDSVLILFGVYYNYRNHFEIFKQIPAGSRASISETQVADTAYKFFELKIRKHQSIEGIEFKNKNYIIDNADGEAYRFSQISELFDTGNGIYRAGIEIFTVNPGFTGDINANPETWNSNKDEGIPESEGKMKALIRKIEENGEIRYVLVEYLKI